MATMPRMPVLFVGHGSPMNALADNSYTRALRDTAARLPRPRAVLVVSAHWMTLGTQVTAMSHPMTIHDFYGFADELFAVNYAAPGEPHLATQVQSLLHGAKSLLDGASFKADLDLDTWGLDHGAWSVLRHMYPAADIPVIQLSLDLRQPPGYHFRIGEVLRPLRDEGVLLIGSGNVVHNLRKISWNENANPFDWAASFNDEVKKKLKARDFSALLAGADMSPAAKLSIPTTEHFIPMLYVLGAVTTDDRLTIEHDEIQNASISMLSFSFGA